MLPKYTKRSLEVSLQQRHLGVQPTRYSVNPVHGLAKQTRRKPVGNCSRIIFCSASADRSRALSRQKTVPGDVGWDPLQVRQNKQVFDRFREVEVIHARWSMLGVLALVFSDVSGHPLYPIDEPSFDSLLPWVVVIALLLAILETYRMKYRTITPDYDSRTYPGKQFDVLGFTKSAGQQPPGLGVYASWLGGFAGWLAGGWWFQRRDMTEKGLSEMKTNELFNGRLAMISFLGCCVASLATGKGPYALLLEHIADPLHNTILQNLIQ